MSSGSSNGCPSAANGLDTVLHVLPSSCTHDNFWLSIPISKASQALLQQHPSGECRSSVYGCCFDNVASASGPQGEGCLNRPNYRK